MATLPTNRSKGKIQWQEVKVGNSVRFDTRVTRAQQVVPQFLRRRQQHALKHNQSLQVLTVLHLHLELKMIADDRPPVRATYRYLDNRPDQINDRGAIAAALPIGSGEIESVHRYVILERLDIAGAWWTVDKAEQLFFLQVLCQNQQ